MAFGPTGVIGDLACPPASHRFGPRISWLQRQNPWIVRWSWIGCNFVVIWAPSRWSVRWPWEPSMRWIQIKTIIMTMKGWLLWPAALLKAHRWRLDPSETDLKWPSTDLTQVSHISSFSMHGLTCPFSVDLPLPKRCWKWNSKRLLDLKSFSGLHNSQRSGHAWWIGLCQFPGASFLVKGVKLLPCNYIVSCITLYYSYMTLQCILLHCLALS